MFGDKQYGETIILENETIILYKSMNRYNRYLKNCCYDLIKYV